jgi:hypothetical protein
MTNGLMVRKTGIEILPAAFTDHNAVVLRLYILTVEVRRRRGRWKMDPVLVTESGLRDKIRIEWAKWRRSRNYYADEVMWWEGCVKTQLQRLIRQEEAERRVNYRHMENHLYESINDILRSTTPETEKLPALQRYKQNWCAFTLRREAKFSWTLKNTT